MSRRTVPNSSPEILRRSYKSVTVAPAGGEFEIRLDERALMTPGRIPVRVESRMVAEAIAAEWVAQTDEIDSRSMHITRLVNSAIDQTGRDRPRVVEAILAYAASDLLCYWAEEPEALLMRQTELWRPPLDWISEHLGERFVTVAGLAHVSQDEATLTAFDRALAGFDPLGLTALHAMAQVMGSAILALAVVEGFLTADAAWQAASLDELWQAEQWGEDAEATARRARHLEELRAAARCLRLARISA